jgi:hypothetical protein
MSTNQPHPTRGKTCETRTKIDNSRLLYDNAETRIKNSAEISPKVFVVSGAMVGLLSGGGGGFPERPK